MSKSLWTVVVLSLCIPGLTACSAGPMYDFTVPTSTPTVNNPQPRIPEGYFPAVWDPSIHSDGPSIYPHKKSFLQQLMKCGKMGHDDKDFYEVERCDPYWAINAVDSGYLEFNADSGYTVIDDLQEDDGAPVYYQLDDALSVLSPDPQEAFLYWTKDEHDPHPTLFRNPFLNQRILLNFIPDQATWRNLRDNRVRLKPDYPTSLTGPVRVRALASNRSAVGIRLLRQSDTLPLSLRVEPRVQCDNPRVKLPKGVVCSIYWWDEARYGDKAPWSTTPVPFPLIMDPQWGFHYQSLLFRTPSWVVKERAKLKAQATVVPAG